MEPLSSAEIDARLARAAASVAPYAATLGPWHDDLSDFEILTLILRHDPASPVNLSAVRVYRSQREFDATLAGYTAATPR